MKNRTFYTLIILIVLGISLTASGAFAQTVPSGKVFNLDKQEKKKSTATKTTNTAVLKGKSYPVYISKGGKMFIKRISEKTGKEYNYYIKTEG